MIDAPRRFAINLAATLSLVAFAAATSVAHAQTAPASQHSLSAHEVSVYAQLLRAADRRELDSIVFHTARASGSGVLRAAAMRTLVQLAPTHRNAALPWLRAIATGSAARGAATASFGLGLVHDTASISLLTTLVRSRGPAARSAAWALGEIGAPARTQISALLSGTRAIRGGASDSVRVALLLAAAKLRPLDFPAVQPFLHSRDATTRWAAAYAIARQRSPAGARALLYASQPDAAFRGEVARELTAKTVGDSLDQPAFTHLAGLASDVDAQVRINAARSLGTYGSRSRAILLRVLNDRDANVRIAAAQSVATAFGSDSAAWRTAWSADTGYKFRRSLVESAVVAGFPIAADSLWRRSPDWKLRASALSAWSASHDTLRARQIALAAGHDPDGRVRATAYDVLASSDTARRDSVVQATLHAALIDPDPVARESLPGYKAPPDSSASNRPIQWYEDVVRRVIVPALNGHPARARLLTSRGEITLSLYGSEAPLTVNNFTNLAARHYYDHATWHRIVPAFVAQDGDPRGDGNGGPGYSIRDELNLLGYARGAVGMALSGPDTGGSQYFLTLSAQPHLDGHYTLFASVTGGLAAMDALVEGDTINSVQIQQ